MDLLNRTPSHAAPQRLAGVALLTLVALLAGCAPRSYVVLLPSPDDSVGQVVVQGPYGEQVLTQAQQGAALNGRTAPFAVRDDQLQRDFGAARAARPELPEQFLLYFENGDVALTDQSQALLGTILERAQARTAVDISVIGHSDTVGHADTNEALALGRAQSIADQLTQLGLPDVVITVDSHGERNLLVPTPDETAEPRNRRVEVTLR